MAEPTSTGGAAGYAAYKLALAYGLPAVLAGVVVMVMTRPRSAREWFIGLLSTVISSISGGAALVEYLSIQHWALTPNGLTGLFGLCFACGLPSWVIVRLFFKFFDKRKDKDLAEVVGEVVKQYDAIKSKTLGE